MSSIVNPTLGMGDDRSLSNYRFAQGFPTRENCDLSNPREAFLWMLVALPGVNGAMLTVPVGYNMAVSEHLWECGARPAAEPLKKWIPPKATGPHWMTSPGRWAPVDSPEDDQEHPADAALAKLTQQQKAELYERLRAMHERGALE
jgi:hypothetical protein